MTNIKQTRVEELRNRGYFFAQISRETQINKNTIKKHFRRKTSNGENNNFDDNNVNIDVNNNHGRQPKINNIVAQKMVEFVETNNNITLNEKIVLSFAFIFNV